MYSLEDKSVYQELKVEQKDAQSCIMENKFELCKVHAEHFPAG